MLADGKPTDSGGLTHPRIAFGSASQRSQLRSSTVRSATAPFEEYVAGLRAAREIRSLPSNLTPEQAFLFTQRPLPGGDSIAANQKPREIVWLLDLLLKEPPRTVLEIGMDRGGTLFLWTRVAAPDALLIGVDFKRIHGRLGRYSPYALVRRSFARDHQRVELIGDADSHAASTVERVRSLLGKRNVDFLFLDADHRYESVTRDFELYAPLVREGGLIAFHDVSPRSRQETEGTARFWVELKETGETMECIDDGALGYGIGLLMVGAGGA